MNICGRSVKFTNMAVLLVCFAMLWGFGMSNADETTPVEEAAIVVNPNLAGADELGALMSKALVDSIMAQRPFLGMEALHLVVSQHLGQEEVEKLYVQMFVPINLNTASEEEILLVPGVGKRMAHEFEEYRPYTAIAQWRREMGKYVDDTEVARMEKYVFVPIDLNTATREEILAVPGVGRRMAREFQEYRPYVNMEQFRREIGKYVDDGEVARLERYVEIRRK